MNITKRSTVLIALLVVVKLVMLLAVVGVVATEVSKRGAVEHNYYEKVADFQNARRFSEVTRIKGEPLEEKLITQDDSTSWIALIYKGYVFESYSIPEPNESSDDCLVRVIKITDPEYRIGNEKVGIGTSRKEIEQVYKYSKKMIDLPPNEFEVYDGGVYVDYIFSKNNVVSEIRLYSQLV